MIAPKINILKYLGFIECSTEFQINWIGCKTEERLNRTDQEYIPRYCNKKGDVLFNDSIDDYLSWNRLIDLCNELNVQFITPDKNDVIALISSYIRTKERNDNPPIVPAINFTEFCEDSDLDQIKYALKFYNKKFKPELVLKYFLNWTLVQDDNGIIILTNKHSNGEWETTMTINDNAEYMIEENTNSWQYLPKTMSEFISDILRYEDFELLLSPEGYNRVYKI